MQLGGPLPRFYCPSTHPCTVPDGHLSKPEHSHLLLSVAANRLQLLLKVPHLYIYLSAYSASVLKKVQCPFALVGQSLSFPVQGHV